MYDRSTSVGASDAVMLAQGKWAELFDRKNTPPDALRASLPARIGHACERMHREWFAEQAGIPVEFDEIWGTEPVRHSERDWMCYLPDGLVREDHYLIPWEGKALNLNWQYNLPTLLERYRPQLQHQMMVMNAPHAYFSVLFLNTHWHWWKIEYDQILADQLWEQEELFHWMLTRGIRPSEWQGKRKGWKE